MRFGKKEIAGSAFVGAGLLLFGKETIVWAYGKLLDTVSAGAPEMTWTAFPWQNAIAAFLTLIGAGLLMWPKPKVKKPTRADRLYGLYMKGDDFVDRVRNDRRLGWFERDHAENRVDLVRDGLSALTFFKNEGLAIPNFQSNKAESICIGLEVYFSALSPIMRDGHLDQVDSHAQSAAHQAEKFAASFNPEKWVIERL